MWDLGKDYWSRSFLTFYLNYELEEKQWVRFIETVTVLCNSSLEWNGNTVRVNSWWNQQDPSDFERPWKVIFKILDWVSKGAIESFYHIYALEINLGSSVDEGKRQEAGRIGRKMLQWKNDNVSAENYTSLWYCNMLESTGVGGCLNMVAKGKGTIGKHPVFWFGDLGIQLHALHCDEEQRNQSKFESRQ